MADYVNNIRLKEITPGDEDGVWGGSTNTNLELIGEAFSYGTIQFAADSNEAFTMADGATDPLRAMYINVTSAGSLTATRTATFAPSTVSKVWFIKNSTTGSQSITIKQGSGAEITIPNGAMKVVATDGAGASGAVVDVLDALDGTKDAIFGAEHTTSDGTHKFTSFALQGSDPTPPSGGGVAYVKNVSGSPQFFLYLDGGTPIQLTSGGEINVSIPDSSVTSNTYTAVTYISSPDVQADTYHTDIVNVSVVAGVATIDWDAGTLFKITVDDDFGITFTNVPSTTGAAIAIIFENQGSYNITGSIDPGLGFTVYKPEAVTLTLTTGGSPTNPTIDMFTVILYSSTQLLVTPTADFVPITT